MPMTHGKEDGNTLLHFASRVGNMLLIRKLLRQGEDINARNRVGQTALDIAEQYQKNEAFLELSRHGAQR
jgi:ankyrin repeat protein